MQIFKQYFKSEQLIKQALIIQTKNTQTLVTRELKVDLKHNKTQQYIPIMQKIPNITLTCLLILFLGFIQQVISDANPADILDNNISTPTQILISKQTHNISAQVTIRYLIQQPSMIYPVYNSKIFNDTKNNCRVQYDVVEKRFGDYIKFQKGQLGHFDSWPVEIIDSTYSFRQQRIFFLLNNGSLLTAPMRTQTQTPNKIETFKQYNYTTLSNSTKDIWQLDNYDMWATDQKLYMVKDRQLYKVTLTDQNTWGIISVEEGTNMLQVIRHKNLLYFVKNDGVHRISPDGTVTKNLVNFTEYQTKGKIEFISLAISSTKMYILCRQQGIFLIDIQQNFEITNVYPIDYSLFAHRIHVLSNTILINYKFYRRTFIAQLFMIPVVPASQPPTLKLNKFFYRFDQMQHVVMFQNYGLIYSLSQMNIFQHSINRNSPFSELDTEFISRAGYPKIHDVIQLDEIDLKYILIENNGIFVEQLGKMGSSATSNLLANKVQCIFSQPGDYSVQIKYEGLCKQHSNPTQSYCSKTNTYNFQVTSEKDARMVQKYNDHAFLLLILLLMLVLVVGAVLAYRRIAEDRREKLMALLQRRSQSQHQMVSTISMGANAVNSSQGSLKTEKNNKYIIQE